MNPLEATATEANIDSETREEATPLSTEETAEEDTAHGSETEGSGNDELTRLREEVKALKASLEQRQNETTEAMRELEEFHRLFPDISVRQIPDEVWKQVEEGLPLRAAYALYEKESRLAVYRAEAVNKRNAAQAAGKIGGGASVDYFSPDEVRAMSQRQVRDNYTTIRESMKKWNV